MVVITQKVLALHGLELVSRLRGAQEEQVNTLCPDWPTRSCANPSRQITVHVS
jgi:hypothetical protein